MIITHDFVACVFNVNAQQILENCQVKCFPVFVVNVSCWCLKRKEKTDQIHQTNFGLVFSNLKHLNKIIDGFLWNALKIKYSKPLFEFWNISNLIFDSIRFSKLLDNLLHFFNIALSVESLWSQMCWFKLFEQNFIMMACLHNFAYWNLIGNLCNGREKLWLISTFKILVLFTVQEGYEIWNSSYVEFTSCIRSLLGIDSAENHVLIFIGLRCCFKSWFDSHTWWTAWRPKVHYNSWEIFDNFRELI